MDWQKLRRWGRKVLELPLSQSLAIARSKAEKKLAQRRARERALRRTTFVFGEGGRLESLLGEQVFAALLPEKDVLAEGAVRDSAAFSAPLPEEDILAEGAVRTFATFSAPLPEGDILAPIPDMSNTHFSAPLPKEDILALAELFCAHRFDLLGSGWQDASFGTQAAGLEGIRYESEGVPGLECLNGANRRAAAEIAGHLPKDYRPIDWQRDFKSGYRWREDVWYLDIKYADVPGADVKVPWELSRMQHLPILAYAYRLTQKKSYADEFVNQLTDWIAANPPQFGVNWRCTMDVGIRIANWLLAWDLFKAAGAAFEPWFEALLADAALAHGRHMADNLEYSPSLCSNHYLSDIAGLLFAAVHLPITKETTAWLAFCLQETIAAMGEQFGGDGANFEASANYHRLSAELMFYCTAIGLGLSEERRQALAGYDGGLWRARPKLRPPAEQEYDLQKPELFPSWFFQRLKKAVLFTGRLMYDGRHIEQIGDNDSGRFFKLHPVWEQIDGKRAGEKYLNLPESTIAQGEIYYDEDILDHSHILRLGETLFGGGVSDIETSIFAGLCGGRTAAVTIEEDLCREDNRRELAALKKELAGKFGEGERQIYRFAAQEDLPEGLKVFCYRDFGLYIFKSPSLYMTARAGSIGQRGNGGHAHNDQLAISLYIGGKPMVRDPGTYLYTPLVNRRNEFRGTAAHFTVQKGDAEQNSWADGAGGTFSLSGDRARGEILSLGTGGIALRHRGFGDFVYRIAEIAAHEIIVTDYGENITRWEPYAYFSAGYGKIEKR